MNDLARRAHIAPEDLPPSRMAVCVVDSGLPVTPDLPPDDPVNGPTFEESLRCLAWGGRILILGFLGGAPALARTNYLLIKGIEAIGVRIGGLSEAHPEIAAANIKTLVELAGEGKLKPRIWRRFPLERAADAVQALIDRQVIGKAVLVG